MDRYFHLSKKTITFLVRNLAIISALLTLIMAFMILFDVVYRGCFNIAFDGIIEMEEFLLSLVVSFGLSYTMVKNGHVKIDLLTSKFSPNAGIVLDGIKNLLGFAFFAIISYLNIERSFASFRLYETADVTKWPYFPFLTALVIGSTLMSIILLGRAISNLKEIENKLKFSKLWCLFVVLLAIFIIVSPGLMHLLSLKLSSSSVAIIGFFVLLSLMFIGLPIAFAMGLVGLGGLWYLTNLDIALNTCKLAVFDTVSNFMFVVIPFFILMGFLFYHAGLSRDLYNAAHKCLGRLPGGLAIGTLAGCAGFSAICGDSAATAATMGSVALPEMRKYGYQDSLSAASVAAGGTLGILIPPSVGFIIYGICTEQSIGKLFMAGFLPGILLVCMFCLIVLLRCWRKPSLGPKGPVVFLGEKVSAVLGIWPVVAAIFVVMGGIYSGVFTATEAGAIGSVSALIIGIALRRLSMDSLLNALKDTAQMSTMILTILIGAELLGYFIAISELPMKASTFLVSLDLSKWNIFILILLLYLFLGMAMNIIPMMLLTLPVIFPIISNFGFDPIWFGVVMVIMMEMGQISPPVGLNVFIISGIGKVPMGKIFVGIFPFLLVEVFVIALLCFFPQIALFLPGIMTTLAPIAN